MNLALWISAGLAAALLAASGLGKLTTPHARLIERFAWVQDFPDPAVKGIGLVDLIGAIGLIVPAAVNIAPGLVPIAAAGVVVLMIAAIVVHVRRSERPVINVALLLLAAFVAWGRFGPHHF